MFSNIVMEWTLVITNKKKGFVSIFFLQTRRFGSAHWLVLHGCFPVGRIWRYIFIDFIDFSLVANKLGLLARGLAEIGPRGGIEGWRWILIIEGLLVC